MHEFSFLISIPDIISLSPVRQRREPLLFSVISRILLHVFMPRYCFFLVKVPSRSESPLVFGSWNVRSNSNSGNFNIAASRAVLKCSARRISRGYDRDINTASLTGWSSDAILISGSQYEKLFEGQASGRIFTTDDSVRPVSTDLRLTGRRGVSNSVRTC